MDNVIIRPVKLEDAEQYINLNNLVWRDAYGHILTEQVFKEREIKSIDKIKNFKNNMLNTSNRLVYVAERDGKIVGQMCALSISNYEYFKNNEYAEIAALYIHPNFQGVGIATKFKQLFLDWAKEKGATKFVVGVLKENTKARKVYESWGGKLDSYSQQFEIMGKGYDEVFYTFNILEYKL